MVMDKEALFKQAVESNKDRIYRICCCYVANDDERKDVYQEVLLHVWKSLDAFEGKAQLSTWIYRIAVNSCLGHLRTEKRRKKVFADDGAVEASEIPDETDGSARTDDDINKLYACISQLVPVDRTLVSLYLEDLGTREIAEILGISEGNVRVKLHRVRKSLKDIWERSGHGLE